VFWVRARVWVDIYAPRSSGRERDGGEGEREWEGRLGQKGRSRIIQGSSARALSGLAGRGAKEDGVRVEECRRGGGVGCFL
jgi:hypothetical protein